MTVATVKIRNTSGEDRQIPALGNLFVMAGQVIEVASDQAESFTMQDGIWTLVQDTKSGKDES